jgi:hypothetical protein
MPPRSRWLWEHRAAGQSLRAIADEGGLSHNKVKRLSRQMVAVLQEAVR